MKAVFSFLSMLFFISLVSGKERMFTGSTPAGSLVRSFLGIPLSDSVDFIRWQLTLSDNRYVLQCHYGIGLVNTNGFINGGRRVKLEGESRKEKNCYRFQNGANMLKAVELNADLLHFLNADNSFLAGNGGWSYTLNNQRPLGTNKVSITAAPTNLKDSMVFVGRTPCNVPGVISPGSLCYKLKWHIVFYASEKVNEPGVYKILGTAWRKEGGRTGTWKIVAGPNGRIVYQLNDENGKANLYLLKPDEHILLFTDALGKLLVGNEDFSYTLNRQK